MKQKEVPMQAVLLKESLILNSQCQRESSWRYFLGTLSPVDSKKKPGPMERMAPAWFVLVTV